MTQSVQRFPLEWPVGWKRITRYARIAGQFSQTKSDSQLQRRTDGTTQMVHSKRVVPVSIYVATQRLEDQLDRLGAKNPTLSTNVSLRLDGRPRSDEEPQDPGAAIYFSFRGKATVLACERYTRVADNIAALAAHIDALRRIERYGVGTIEQALAGYKALPADTAADWRQVFGLNGTAKREDVDREFKRLARERHPDVTHDDGAAMAHLNRARDYAFAELTS